MVFRFIFYFFCILLVFAGIFFPSIALGQSNDKEPLPIPENFDPKVNMLAKTVEGQKFHAPRASVRFCEELLENGTPKDIELVERMMPGILSGQETDPGSPHYGAFRWEIEMEMVEDLNAVEFLLHSLIPIIIDHQEKLADSTVSNIKESIHMGLQNIKAIDVNVKYTNIVLKDIANTCLGGELLKDTALAQRGYDKLKDWIAFTDRSGGVYEYNSTPYTAVAIEVLYRLQKYVQNPEIKFRARQMLWRVALSAGLHMHLPTGRWAGPHGRAYHGSVIGEGGSYLLQQQEMHSFRGWIEEGKLPDWMRTLLSPEMVPDQLKETVGIDDGLATYTYKADNYSFGVASRNMSNQANRYIAWQSNVFTLHYQRLQDTVPGAIYTRYLLNDHWLGYFSAGIGRGTNGLLPDEGHFQGVQDGNRAIGLYVPQAMGALDHFSSAKSVIAVPRWNETDKIWQGKQEIKTFPTTIQEGEVLVIESGKIMMAMKPFALTDLGKGSSIVVDMMPDGTLVVECYNYRGPAKTFWELAWPGAFYQGMPQNGFYAEVAEKDAYKSAGHFAETVASGEVVDEADPRSTYSGSETRKWRVSYSREGRTLGMEVDLFDWSKPARRWTRKGNFNWPMLESKFALQNRKGKIDINGNILTCSAQPAWLYASPDGRTVVASYHGPGPSSVQLKTAGGGELNIKSLKGGLIVWQDDKVTIEAIGLQGQPEIKKGKLTKLTSYEE